jgi:hypothetical protein
MLRRIFRRLKQKAYVTGLEEGARQVFEMWISEEGYYWLIEDQLKKYNLVYENGRVRHKDLNVDPDV